MYTKIHGYHLQWQNSIFYTKFFFYPNPRFYLTPDTLLPVCEIPYNPRRFGYSRLHKHFISCPGSNIASTLPYTLLPPLDCSAQLPPQGLKRKGWTFFSFISPRPCFGVTIKFGITGLFSTSNPTSVMINEPLGGLSPLSVPSLGYKQFFK